MEEIETIIIQKIFFASFFEHAFAMEKLIDKSILSSYYICNGYIRNGNKRIAVMKNRTIPYQPLTPAVYHILLALVDGEKHGYAIMKDVEAQTGGQLKMGPGTLYGCIKRMLAAGLIEEADERPDPALDDERRRYYRLTGLGANVVSVESERLARAVKVAQQKHILASS
jgi:DNA-binding PadR family transcriptional regulator